MLSGGRKGVNRRKRECWLMEEKGVNRGKRECWLKVLTEGRENAGRGKKRC